MSGAVLLAIISVICVTDLAIAFHFSRKADDQARNLDTIAAAKVDPGRARTMSRLMFIVTPLVWLFFVALTFGLFGPVDGITTIKI